MPYEKLYDDAGIQDRMLDVFEKLLTERPSRGLLHTWLYTDNIDLQDFCACKAKLSWMTGISIIDTVFTIVDGAYGNTNIDEHGCDCT